MKRLGNIYSKLCRKNTALAAIYDGTRQKHHDPMVQKKLLYSKEQCKADPTLEGQIDPKKAFEVADIIIGELKDGTYYHRKPLHKERYCTSKSKAYGKGKVRQLYVPTLYDHILHHMLMIASMDAFMRGMDKYCCGSIPNRGHKIVVNAVERWVRYDKNIKYFVKLDIRHFFDSIPRDKMMDCLRAHIKDEQVLDLWWKVISSAPVAAPIGYYTSPWLGNLYLQDLDHFIRQELYKERRGKRIPYVRRYIRYADDMLLMGSSKRDLEKAVYAIKEKLLEKGLELKSCWEIKQIAELDENGKAKKGTYRVDMCGYVFDRSHTRLRSGIYLSTMRESRSIAKIQHQGLKPALHDCQALMSKIGWAKHADCAMMTRRINAMVDMAEVKEVISNAQRRAP